MFYQLKALQDSFDMLVTSLAKILQDYILFLLS